MSNNRQIVYITGMSGVGKSTSLMHLSRLGYAVVDTDSDVWSEWVIDKEGHKDWILREDKIQELINNHKEGALFISGCKTNQGKFYHCFDHVVLLTAPIEI